MAYRSCEKTQVPHTTYPVCMLNKKHHILPQRPIHVNHISQWIHSQPPGHKGVLGSTPSASEQMYVFHLYMSHYICLVSFFGKIVSLKLAYNASFSLFN